MVLPLVLTAEDTELAVEHGVDSIIVSNHGGRQLDGVVATAEVLPEVVAAAKGRVPVHVDGGVRKGTDIFKASIPLHMKHIMLIIPGFGTWRRLCLGRSAASLGTCSR